MNELQRETKLIDLYAKYQQSVNILKYSVQVSEIEHSNQTGDD